MPIIRDDQKGKLTKGGYNPVVQAVSDLAAHVTERDSPTPPDEKPAAPAAPSGPAKLPDLDWSAAFFGSLGLPADVQARVNQIFQQYSDTSAATSAATAYIRGTPWYDQTFPGIKDAFAKGIVSNETEYRSLLNQQTQFYKQYLGRDITAGEFAANLVDGATSQTIVGRLQGGALAKTYGNDWRQVLGNFGEGAPTDAEVQALGEEQAGLDSPLGQSIKRRLDMAHERFQGVFRGRLAAPGLSLANGRLSAPGLQGGNGPDVGA